MSATILCINSGSSSLKFALFGPGEQRLAEGLADRIGQPEGRFTLKGSKGFEQNRAFPDQGAAIDAMFEALDKTGMPKPEAAGHRIVHGGPKHFQPELVTKELLASLKEAIPLAPLHLPGALRGIEAIQERLPELPQVACFDTAFHAGMPEVARRLPLPREFWDEGVRKYGFHGLSYEYIVGILGSGADGRTIIAHLGNGASMAAVRDGKPVDTTMGLTPTGGLVMGTRTGDIDPSVTAYLLKQKGWDADALEQCLNKKSGLLGISGSSSDMRTLMEKRSSGDVAATQAIESFCYSARKHIGALAAALGGLDTLVFTGGIGEHAAPVRAEICQGLEYLGVTLDQGANEKAADTISTGKCVVRVIATDEDVMIARHTQAIIDG